MPRWNLFNCATSHHSTCTPASNHNSPRLTRQHRMSSQLHLTVAAVIGGSSAVGGCPWMQVAMRGEPVAIGSAAGGDHRQIGVASIGGAGARLHRHRRCLVLLVTTTKMLCQVVGAAITAKVRPTVHLRAVRHLLNGRELRLMPLCENRVAVLHGGRLAARHSVTSILSHVRRLLHHGTRRSTADTTEAQFLVLRIRMRARTH